jgi:hypothetical protein
MKTPGAGLGESRVWTRGVGQRRGFALPSSANQAAADLFGFGYGEVGVQGQRVLVVLASFGGAGVHESVNPFVNARGL